MKSTPLLSRFCLHARPTAYGFAIGIGVGVATKNWAIGLAVGLVFSLAFNASRRNSVRPPTPESKS